MPVEIRTCDGRHFARPVIQNHAPLPLVRRESHWERRRRHREAARDILIIFSAASALLAFIPF